MCYFRHSCYLVCDIMRYTSSTNATQLEYAVDANLHTAIQSVRIRPTMRTCVRLIRSIRLCRIRLELRLRQDVTVTIHHGLGRCSSFNPVSVHGRRWAPDEGAATLIKINRMQITFTSTRGFCEKFWGLLEKEGTIRRERSNVLPRS